MRRKPSASDFISWPNSLSPGTGGRRVTLPLQHADRFSVYEADTLQLAVKDKIRITKDGFTPQEADGRRHKLINGSIYDVAGFTRQGDIRLNNGWVVDRNYGNLAHGYVTTIDSAQGSEAERVFLAIGSESLRPANAKRFYSAVTRGKYSVTIYTDDKDMLKRAAVRSGERLSATELLREEQEADRQERREKARRYNDLVNRHRALARAEGNGATARKEQVPPPVVGKWTQREQEQGRVKETELERER